MKNLLVALLLTLSTIAIAKDLDARAEYRLCVANMDDAPKQAAKHCQSSAAQGFAQAQFTLGWFYEEGIGVAKNGDEAMKWYKAAADQGYDEAQYKLGIKERPAGTNWTTAPSAQTSSDDTPDAHTCELRKQIYLDCAARHGIDQCGTEMRFTFPCNRH